MKKDQIKHKPSWYLGRVYNNKEEFIYDLLSAREDAFAIEIILGNALKSFGRWT